MAIPVLSDIPILGPILFNQNIVVYLMYIVVIVINVALFRTKWGLRVRAVGEHPTAADTVGIKVNSVRFRNVLLGGMVAGLGGAFFTVASVGAFGKEMTAGKGFIALAALIFGRWKPLGALAAALFFGFADNLQSVLSIIGTPIPSEFMLMTPTWRHCWLWPDSWARCGHRRPTASRTRSHDRLEGSAEAATAALSGSYVPYSSFPVGAAALVDDGRIISGCNVENASYGLTLCAECTLVGALRMSGGGRLVAFSCVDGAGNLLMPCGRCRQLLYEFGGPDLLVDHP